MLLKFFIKNFQYTGRKSLSTKTQSNQNREREGILNQSPKRERIQRKKTCSSSTIIMHVISKGVGANSALKARKPRADCHQFQVIRHNQCRHRLSPLDSRGGCELLLDGHYCRLQWLTWNAGCVSLYVVPLYNLYRHNLASRACSGPPPPSEINSFHGRAFASTTADSWGGFPGKVVGYDP